MIRSVKTWLPLFSYQAILSSIDDAESTSVSPSPSTSAAKTERAPSALVEMIRCVKTWLPLFSYQAIMSSLPRRREHIHVPITIYVCRDDV